MSHKSNASPGELRAKLSTSAHVMCGWPLLLVAIGGAVGGGVGGAAYGINVAIYESRFPVPIKVVLNVLVGMAALGIWYAIATAVYSARNWVVVEAP